MTEEQRENYRKAQEEQAKRLQEQAARKAAQAKPAAPPPKAKPMPKMGKASSSASAQPKNVSWYYTHSTVHIEEEPDDEVRIELYSSIRPKSYQQNRAAEAAEKRRRKGWKNNILT